MKALESLLPKPSIETLARVVLLAFVLLGCACQPRIGDDCRVNQDCSGERQRLCDTSQPGGYCTLANCSESSCPEGEGICVMFNSSSSAVSACEYPGKLSPSARTFCMKTCEWDKDCRPDYYCTDLSVPDDPWGALVVQKNPQTTKVCISRPIGKPIASDHPAEVCEPGFSPGGSSSD